MSPGNCPVCPGNGCDGRSQEPLSTLDIETCPDGSSCSVPIQPATEGQEVSIDSSKTKNVDVKVEISTNHPTLVVDGAKEKRISVPAQSSNNEACFDLQCNSGNAPRQVGIELEVTLERGRGRPSNHLTTLKVQRRP